MQRGDWYLETFYFFCGEKQACSGNSEGTGVSVGAINYSAGLTLWRKGNKCWIGRELDRAAILSALVSSMATKRPEMTPQETQVSQGGTFPRSLLHSVTGWKQPMGCGSDGHQRPPCAHRSTSLPGLQSSPSWFPTPPFQRVWVRWNTALLGGLDLGSQLLPLFSLLPSKFSSVLALTSSEDWCGVILTIVSVVWTLTSGSSSSPSCWPYLSYSEAREGSLKRWSRGSPGLNICYSLLPSCKSSPASWWSVRYACNNSDSWDDMVCLLARWRAVQLKLLPLNSGGQRVFLLCSSCMGLSVLLGRGWLFSFPG